MKLTVRLKGGVGSGNFGHAGRPGKVGGSMPGKMQEFRYEIQRDKKMGKYPGFDETKVDMPIYDNMLANPEYFESAKGLKFEIVGMSPKTYMNLVAIQQNTTTERLSSMVSRSIVQKYADMMERGIKFPMLLLDNSKYKGQEGRHRALAAMQAYPGGFPIRKVPVMIVENVD